MAKLKLNSYYASISGLHLVTDRKGKYSPEFEIYNMNMKRLRGQTYRPFTHDVPNGGLVLQIVYEQNEDKLIFYDKQK